MSVYLDYNATTPVDPRVAEVVMHYMTEEYGNAGSRTHDYGLRAKQAVQHAREQVANVVSAARDEVLFTSGATESNNIAILGLAAHANEVGRQHIVSTAIEHKAVLEPAELLQARGFDVTLVPSTPGGWVDAEAVCAAVRADTILVSVMQVNNETGVIQPIQEIAEGLCNHSAYFHVDAAQGFGKELEGLQHERVDMISISGHKIYGPKGIGALVLRQRGYARPPLAPLIVGGGQERGLRPGTLPVPLVAGLGLAAELAASEHQQRKVACETFRAGLLTAVAPLKPSMNGDTGRTVPHVLNLSLRGIDSEALMVAVKGLLAISNGSACTSQSYEPSHVLAAMGLDEDRCAGAVRVSWSHNTSQPDWEAVRSRIAPLG